MVSSSSAYTYDEVINMSAAIGACGSQIRLSRGKGIVVVMGTGESNRGFTPDTVSEVLAQTSTIIAVSTTGFASRFSSALGIPSKDVLKLGSLLDLTSVIEGIIPSIC